MAPNPGLVIGKKECGLPFAIVDAEQVVHYKAAIEQRDFSLTNHAWHDLLVKSLTSTLCLNLRIQQKNKVEAQNPQLFLMSPDSELMAFNETSALLCICLQGYYKGGNFEIFHGPVLETVGPPADPRFVFQYVGWIGGARAVIRPPTDGHRLLLVYTLSNTISAAADLQIKLQGLSQQMIAGRVPPILVSCFTDEQDTKEFQQFVKLQCGLHGFSTLFAACHMCSCGRSCPADTDNDWKLHLVDIRSLMHTCTFVSGISVKSDRSVDFELSRASDCMHVKSASSQRAYILWLREKQWVSICERADMGSKNSLDRLRRLVAELDADDRSSAFNIFAKVFSKICYNNGLWGPVEEALLQAMEAFGVDRVCMLLDVLLPKHYRNVFRMQASLIQRIHSGLRPPSVSFTNWCILKIKTMISKLDVVQLDDAAALVSVVPLCGLSVLEEPKLLTITSNSVEGFEFWTGVIVALAHRDNITVGVALLAERLLRRVIDDHCLRDDPISAKADNNLYSPFNLALYSDRIPTIVESALKIHSTCLLTNLADRIPTRDFPPHLPNFGDVIRLILQILARWGLRPCLPPFRGLLFKFIDIYITKVLGPQPEPPRNIGPQVESMGCVCAHCNTVAGFLSDASRHCLHHSVPRTQVHSIFGSTRSMLDSDSSLKNCPLNSDSTVSFLIQKRPLSSDPYIPRAQWLSTLEGCRKAKSVWVCISCREATICTVCEKLEACVAWDKRWSQLKGFGSVISDLEIVQLLSAHPLALAWFRMDQPPDYSSEEVKDRDRNFEDSKGVSQRSRIASSPKTDQRLDHTIRLAHQDHDPLPIPEPATTPGRKQKRSQSTLNVIEFQVERGRGPTTSSDGSGSPKKRSRLAAGFSEAILKTK